MGDWKSNLKADPTNWLLEEDNPSVRFFTLTELLDKPLTDGEVMGAKNAIMNVGVVPKILAKQNSDGSWEAPTAFYTAKYKGTVWQLIVLAELGADKADDRVRKACEFILENSQHHESHGFSMARAEKTGGGRQSGVIPCLTGNMVFSLIRLATSMTPECKRGLTGLQLISGLMMPTAWERRRVGPTTDMKCATANTVATWAQPKP